MFLSIHDFTFLRTGSALPLGELDHCLRPPSGRGLQNFEKKGQWEKIKIKNLVLDEISKIIIHPCEQRTKNLEHSYEHWYSYLFLSLTLALCLFSHPCCPPLSLSQMMIVYKNTVLNLNLFSNMMFIMILMVQIYFQS